MEIAGDIIQHISENEEVEGIEGPAEKSGHESIALVGPLRRTLRYKSG